MIMKPFHELGGMWAHVHGLPEPERTLTKTIEGWELVGLTFIGG